MPACEICHNKKTIQFHSIAIYTYYFCRVCLTLFLFPKPRKRFITSYYSQNFDYSAGRINEIKIRSQAKTIVKKLRQLHPLGQSLLDIGSGYGFFLEEAIQAGLKSEGIDPSGLPFGNTSYLSDSVKRMTFDHYHKLYPRKKFDFITIIHTIEHVIDPVLLILRSFQHLNHGGILYIETPNLDSHLFYTEKYNYTFLTPPAHLWIFSQFSFSNMSSLWNAASIQHVSTYSSPEHFMGIVKQLLKPTRSEVTNAAEVSPKKVPSLSLKYLFFDTLLAPLCTPFLNRGRHGSILELYIKKY